MFMLVCPFLMFGACEFFGGFGVDWSGLHDLVVCLEVCLFVLCFYKLAGLVCCFKIWLGLFL